MNIIQNTRKQCLCCMSMHDVQTVSMKDTVVFKGEELSFEALYEYCTEADETLETEDMAKMNDLSMTEKLSIQ